MVYYKSKTSTSDFDFTTQFESLNGTQTPKYFEVISYYEQLAELKIKIKPEKVSDKRFSSSSYNQLNGNFEF